MDIGHQGSRQGQGSVKVPVTKQSTSDKDKGLALFFVLFCVVVVAGGRRQSLLLLPGLALLLPGLGRNPIPQAQAAWS